MTSTEFPEAVQKELPPPFIAIDDAYRLPATGTGYTHHVPELKLLATLLADALEQALRRRNIRDPGDRREAEVSRREAIEWIFSEDPSWPCSFVAVCTILNLEPTGIRREVARRLDRGLALPTDVRRLTRTVSRGIRRERRRTPSPRATDSITPSPKSAPQRRQRRGW